MCQSPLLDLPRIFYSKKSGTKIALFPLISILPFSYNNRASTFWLGMWPCTIPGGYGHIIKYWLITHNL